MSDELGWVRRLRPDDEADDRALARVREALMAQIQSAAAPAAATPGVIPQLAYRDIEAALGWLARAFGFREREDGRFVGPDGRVGHAEMDLGNGGFFMMGSHGGHGLGSPARIGGASQMLCVFVNDVDAHCARARAAGATIRAELEDKFWGDRTYEAVDLEGHVWAFHQRLHPPADGEG